MIYTIFYFQRGKNLGSKVTAFEYSRRVLYSLGQTDKNEKYAEPASALARLQALLETLGRCHGALEEFTTVTK